MSHALDTESASLSELVSHLSQETAALVRDELRLAQLEMSRKAKYAGIGAGLLGAAAVLASCAVATLIAAAVLGLATAMPAWAAALVVAGVLLAAAGAAALVGKREVTEAVPPVPTEAVESVKIDLDSLKR